jgi:Protein of unknown function (DUF3574)
MRLTTGAASSARGRRLAPAIAIVIALAACAPAAHTGVGAPVVVERLFFGRNANGAEVVSDAAWGAFLAEVVTPRFPQGFAAWRAQGQWRRADGAVEREASFVLELIHPPSTEADESVAAIVAAYKVRFRQEAVLRLVLPGHAAF